MEQSLYKIDQAATSLITGFNITNGFLIDACWLLAVAKPAGHCHNGDEKLQYYHFQIFSSPRSTARWPLVASRTHRWAVWPLTPGNLSEPQSMYLVLTAKISHDLTQ